MSRNILKKITAAICIITCMIAFTMPRPAHAVLGANDTVFTLGSIPTFLQTIFDKIRLGYQYISSAASAAMSNKETYLDAIAWAAAKAIVASLTKSIVNWINNGFHGSPAFVQDLQGQLRNIADDIAADFIQGAGLGGLCEPFALNIRGALSIRFNQYIRPEGTRIDRCTFTDITKNIQNFGVNVNGQRVAGAGATPSQVQFSDFVTYTSNPVNTPQGAYLDAQAKLEASVENSKAYEAKTIDFGSGFLSYKKCEKLDNGKQYCSIVTPGDTISASLNKSLGLGADSLVTADEINEIVSAFIGQMLKSVLQDGLAGVNTATADMSVTPIVDARPQYDGSIVVQAVDDILPSQNRAIAAMTTALRDIELQCIEPLPEEDEYGQPLTYTEEEVEQHEIDQLTEKHMIDPYDIYTQKLEDAQFNATKLAELKARASQTTDSGEMYELINQTNAFAEDENVYKDTTELVSDLYDLSKMRERNCPPPEVEVQMR